MDMTITLEKLRRTQIMEAALKKVSLVGIQNITMDDIALEAGLSKGGIAYYFSSKDLLIKEAFRNFFDAIFLRGKQTMDLYLDPLDKLLSFVWLYNWDDPLAPVGYPMLFDAMSLAGHDADYRSLLEEWFNGWISLLSDALEEGVASGQFVIRDIKGTAQAISSIYQGVATRWFLGKNSHSTEWAISFSRITITSLLKEVNTVC